MRAGPAIRHVLRELKRGDADLIAWEQGGLPLDRFEDWLTDRVARRPGRHPSTRDPRCGRRAHSFAPAILGAPRSDPTTGLLQMGCDGGLLLRDAAACGAAVTGVHRSEEMLHVARERAPGTHVRLARAEALPFADDDFTAVAMSGAFRFLSDPVVVVRASSRDDAACAPGHPPSAWRYAARRPRLEPIAGRALSITTKRSRRLSGERRRDDW